MEPTPHPEFDRPRVVAGDWVVARSAPGERAARNGGVRIAPGGAIVAVGPVDDIADAGDEVVRLPGCVLTAGLVNAHAHLDLSYWAGRRDALAGKPLHDWVVPVVGERFMRSAGEVAAAAAAAARDSLAAGVTTVVDITPASIAWAEVLDAVAAIPLRRVAMAEAIGFGARARSIWSDAERALTLADQRAGRGDVAPGANAALGVGAAHAFGVAAKRLAASLATRAAPDELFLLPPLAVGLAPHAPYSTTAELYANALAEAVRAGRPITTHLAETAEEVEFTRTGGGPWRRRLEQIAGPQPDLEVPGCSPVAYADRLGLLAYEQTLLSHVNYLCEGDADRLSAGRATVVYCPRTADFFGHRDHPWRRLLAAGVNVAVGTDSLASSPDVSMRGELAWLRGRYPDVPCVELFALATRRPAAALGLAGLLGELAVGAAGDIVAWPIEARGGDDAESLLAAVLDSPAAPAAVFVAGRRVI